MKQYIQILIDDESIVGNGNMNNTCSIRSRRQTHEKIKLQNGLGFMHKRKRQAILCTKRYKEHTEKEKYYHAKLLLYFPWVDEDMILRGHESYQEAYDAKCEIVAANAKRFNDECDILTWFLMTLIKMQCFQYGILQLQV